MRLRRSVVFVHGTSVRAEGFRSTLATVRAQVTGRMPDVAVRGCLWGEQEGAGLACGGASVPGYGTRDGTTRDDAGAEAAVWAVLYEDPGYELRLLGLGPPPAQGLTGGLPPAQRLLTAVSGYQPSDATRAAFARHGLERELTDAVRQVAASSELRDAAATADANGHEHRHAAARAVVAAALAAAAGRGADAVTAATRDDLLSRVSTELHGEGRPIGGMVRKVAAASAVRLTRRYGNPRRGALTDRVLPAVGDILRYQARGEGIRSLIRRAVRDAPGDSVTLLGHSLGGVACVDLLAMEEVPRVDQLVTVGSQAPFLYEAGALVSLAHPAQPPEHFPRRWLNVYDPQDWLSYRAAPVFPGVAYDLEVTSGQPFLMAHSAYWSSEEMWEQVVRWMR